VDTLGEHDLGPDLGRLGDDGGDVTGAGHRGLIDDHHGRRGDLAPLDEVAGDRRRPDPGSVLQLTGRPCRRRESDDGPTRVLIRGPEGAERVGLAGASAADHHRDSIARTGQRPNRAGLIVTERRPTDVGLH
jgi:hypothetical protein